MNRFERLRHYISELEGSILSAKRLSRLLGFSEPLIGRIERGDTPPSKKVAVVLEEKYRISKEWFLTGEGIAPWEEKTHEESRKYIDKLLEESKAENVNPGKSKLSACLLAVRLLFDSPYKRLLDFIIEAGRNPEYAAYIYNVLESGPSRLLEQNEEARARIKELEGRLRGRESGRIPYRKAQAVKPGGLRKTASRTTTFESVEVNLEIPDPPADILPEDKKRWLKNAEALSRWQNTNKSFYVPSWALERFCREVYHFYEGAELADVGGLLKDFVEEGREY